MPKLRGSTGNCMQSIGKKGEEFARKYLEQEGYEVMEQNWRFKKSEIDLIAKHNHCLVFFEVKTRSQTYFGQPESFVTENQQAAIFRGAEQYLIEKEWQGDIRFDVLAIHWQGAQSELTHLKDAFY